VRAPALAVALASALVLAAPAGAALTRPKAAWDVRVDDAIRYAEARAGSVSFAVTDEDGRRRGYRVHAVAHSASVFKAMLLVTYLRQASVRDRDLREYDRALLAPMIRRSDNTTATAVRNIVGAAAIYRLAEKAGMERFVLRIPWGASEITAADQAGYFRRIDRLVPRRHRAYARYLLASIVLSQRWGIPPVKPSGWAIFFKGGWGSGTGAVTHQVALLERRARRLSLAVLTVGNPSHEYGTRTVRGVAARLLRGIPRGVASTIFPTGADGYRAWSASSDAAPLHFDAYVSTPGETPVRVNPGGTQAHVGDIDGTTLVYSERRGRRGDVKLYDLVAGPTAQPPAGINTKADEWAPSLSGDRLLFGRASGSTERILLADLGTGAIRKLDSARGSRYVQPGRVSGNYAVWIRCRRSRRCSLFRHDLATGTTLRLPNPRGRAQYAASVTDDGTVYFVESRHVLCGARASLWRYRDGVRTRLLALPGGRDVATTDPVANLDGTTTLVYDRIVCGTWRSHLAELSTSG
jgi:hypothetical protein